MTQSFKNCKLDSQEGIDEGVVEVLDLVVPTLHRSLPAAGKVAELVQVLADLEPADGPAVGAVVVGDALVGPRLGSGL